MQPIATSDARAVVCVSVCACVGHTGELCKNCWTDWDADLGWDWLMWVEETVYDMGV